MTATTIYGIVTKIGATVEIRNAGGRTTAATRSTTSTSSSPAPPSTSTTTKQRVGTITYAEITRDNQVAVVAVLDGDELTRIERDTFFSGTFLPAAPYDRRSSFVVDRARLAGVSLTFSPALRSAAWPVGWMPGDGRSAADRNTWPLSWRTAYPLLAHAADYQHGTTRNRSAQRIVDRREYGDEPPPLTSLERARLQGPLQHGAPGRVLRVY
jgi:hypothetical protein